MRPYVNFVCRRPPPAEGAPAKIERYTRDSPRRLEATLIVWHSAADKSPERRINGKTELEHERML